MNTRMLALWRYIIISYLKYLLGSTQFSSELDRMTEHISLNKTCFGLTGTHNKSSPLTGRLVQSVWIDRH